MKRRALSSLVVAAAAGALAIFAAPAGAVPNKFYGVVPQDQMTRADYDNLDRLNAGTFRVIFFWSGFVHPKKDQCCDWDVFDSYVANASRSGATVQPYIIGAPHWASDNFVKRPPIKGKAAKGWKVFLRALVERYGRQGTFWKRDDPYGSYKPITRWQIWNEPSSPDYWAKPNPRKYAKLVKLSGKAIHSVEKKADVMLAGLFAAPGKGVGRMPIETFLKRFYKVPKIKRYFDMAALHPYARAPKTLGRRLTRMRRLMRNGGDRKTPIRITEMGWASGGAKSPFTVGEKGQAKKLRRSFKLLTKKRGKWRLKGVDWYSLQDIPDDTGYACKWCPQTGLTTQSRNPKPAFDAFREFTG